MMGPRLRSFSLTVHVVSSVGWLGAVVSFLVLAVAGLTARDARTMEAAYLAAELITWFVIVPLCMISLTGGIVQSLGTKWGLFQHYWVLFKLGLTAVATIVLLLHTQPIARVASFAASSTLSSTDLRAVRIQLLADAAAALVILLVSTVLGIYKPRGLTAYGWRKQGG
jgi:hypothetical protein